MSTTFAIRGERVVLEGGVHAAAVIVAGEKIAAVVGPDAIPPGLPIIDAGTAAVMPGLVDTHVHLNDPGRVEWEGFETGTRAAAAGGITTLVDMPLNCIPVTTTLSAFHEKLAAAKERICVDVGFWGGVVPGNVDELEPMIDAGVLGFKAFLIHSGIDEFPAAREEDLRAAMKVLARRGIPLLVHAEVETHTPDLSNQDPRRYATFLASRPPAWEVEAIRMVIALCRETGCAVHVVHLSAADALGEIAAAKREGLPVTAETCPHYLVFAAEEIADGATELKCCPPIREAENRERLWEGLRDGTIDFIACDHSPCTPAQKLPEAGDFMAAWGGIASVQFSFPIVWTHARARGHDLLAVSRWLSQRTARFAGLSRKKGLLAAGYDADVVICHLEERFHLERYMIRHRHAVTPYAGFALDGVVEKTFLRGREIYRRDAFVEHGCGVVLRRERLGSK